MLLEASAAECERGRAFPEKIDTLRCVLYTCMCTFKFTYYDALFYICDAEVPRELHILESEFRLAKTKPYIGPSFSDLPDLADLPKTVPASAAWNLPNRHRWSG